MTKRFLVLCLLLLTIIVVTTTAVSGSENCFPSRQATCAQRPNHGYIRSVQCSRRATNVNVCCEPTCNQGVTQRNRQTLFRMVTAMLSSVSDHCTERIVCEMGCMDGLANGTTRLDYPVPTASDSSATKRYIDSFLAGEAMSCFGLQTRGQNSETTRALCRRECGKLVPQCDLNRASPLVRLMYSAARPVHVLVMYAFDVLHPVSDDPVTGSDELTTIYEGLMDALKRFQ